MTSPDEDTDFNPFASPRTSPPSESDSDAREISLSQYAMVRLGLRMIYNSIGVLAGVFLMTVLTGGLVAANGRGIGNIFPATLVFFAYSLICSIVVLALVAGFCMTLTSPRRNEKSLATISVFCFFLSIGGVVVGISIPRLLFLITGVSAEVLVPLAVSIPINVSAIFFCLFLKRVGQNISSSQLEKSAGSMLVWYGLFLLVWVAGWVTMLVYTVDWFEVAFGLTMVVVAFVSLFKFLAMIRTGTFELKPRQRPNSPLPLEHL